MRNGKMGLSEYLKNGTAKSSMRLIFVLTGFTACLIAATAVGFQFVLSILDKKPLDLNQIAALVGVLLGAVTLGKVGQSVTEAKDSRKPEDNK